MGKENKPPSRKKKKVCATKELHHGGEDDLPVPLRHPRRISVSTTTELLQRCGRLSSRLNGSVCINCIREVEGERFHNIDYVPIANLRPILVDFTHSPSPFIQNEVGLAVSDTELEDTADNENVSELSDSAPSYQPMQSEPPGVETNTDTVIVLSPGNLRQDLTLLSGEMRAMLAYELAAGERMNIRADVWKLTMLDFRNIQSLSNICKPEYLNARNPVLSHFLTGLWEGTHPKTTKPTSNCADLPVPVKEQSHIYKLAKAIEACMGLTMPIAVLPFHFREIVLLYSQTRSRTALSLLSGTAPHGCYQTVRNWLDKLAQTGSSIKLPTSKGDTLCVFDNNQVLQRRWNICVDNRSMCSIVTMVMFMDIDTEGTLQFQEELKPRNWMWLGLDEAKRATLKEAHTNEIHRETRYLKHFHPWLTNIIKQVAREQTVVDGRCMDAIDSEVASNKNSEQFKACPACGVTNIGLRKRVCPSCGLPLPSAQSQRDKEAEKGTEAGKAKKNVPRGDVRVMFKRKDDTTYGMTYERQKVNATDYDHLPQQHPVNPPKLRVTEPIFVNPCSYKAVAEVFRRIGKQAGIRKYGGQREWLTVVCDGLPYILGYQITERTFECGLCDLSVHGLSECEKHQEEHQKKHEGDCQYRREFDWVLLQPGPGHIEMNMLKTFVKFAWPIFWEDMVEIFNFKSEIAKRSAQNVSDFHKGMALARIARESLAKELVLPYVRQKMLEGSVLSAAGYLDFTLKTVKSPNYALVAELTMTMLDAIFLYRAGLRSGDMTMMEAGRAIFARMWLARSHPLYRQLVMYDTIMMTCMPPPLLNFIQKTKSFNLHGVPYSGEGADFKLEEVNKSVQHWIPSVPSNKDWINACANHQKMSQLKETALSEMEMKDRREELSKSIPDFSPEVSAFRTAIRERNFIADHDKETPITSFGKQPLDPDLADFAKTAAKHEAIYLQNFLNHERTGGFMKKLSVPFNEPPVFITPEERSEYNSIENRTVNELVTLITTKIDAIGDEEIREDFFGAFQTEVLSKKGKKKRDYIDFYELLEEYEIHHMDTTTGSSNFVHENE